MSQFKRFEQVYGGDAEKETRFALLHDFLKAKREDAEDGRQDALERDDDRDLRAFNREISIANRWLNDLFEDWETFHQREVTEAKTKVAKWIDAVNVDRQ